MLKMPPVRYDTIKLQGGVDQVTPMLSLAPGVARAASNFEHSITGGYTRIAGYDRFDGRPNPSDATYVLLTLSLTGSVAIGNTITGATSGATAKVIAIDGENYAVTRQVGLLLNDEDIRVGGVVVGHIASIPGLSGNLKQDAEFSLAAANDYRTDIQPVPGSGNILGVAFHNGVLYAWRNNTLGTAAVMYKSTSSGWAAVSLGYELSFSAGTAAISDGQTVTGASSGATGVVGRVVLESGDWGAGTAAGRLILTSKTGTFSAENLLVGGSPKATAAGAATAITLAPNGRYETDIGNFAAGAVNSRLYGCDGVNRGFEFDGTIYVPIVTGMSPDSPSHVAVHKQHLFFAFRRSLQFSSLGTPYQWNPLTGAAEIGMEESITNLLIMPGDQTTGALGVFTRNTTAILYGSGASNFQLSTFNSGTGGRAYTAQNMDQSYVLDDRGVTSLNTTLNYGNFAPSALTMKLRPFLQLRRNLATGACVNREKSQYRVFFSDGSGLYLTLLNGKFLGAMPVQFSHPVMCIVEGEKPDGTETSFFGSNNGYVYRLDAGTSFDGQVIPANVNLVINPIGSPRILKRYRKASVEMTGESYAEFSFGYDLAYRSTDISQSQDVDINTYLRAGSFWDQFVFDQFVWDGSDITPSEVEISGTAENIAVRITSVSNLYQPFTVNSVTLHYTPRRGIR